MCLYSSVQNFMENISTFGVDFDQYLYVSIDFVLNTQIENIGQNQPACTHIQLFTLEQRCDHISRPDAHTFRSA